MTQVLDPPRRRAGKSRLAVLLAVLLVAALVVAAGWAAVSFIGRASDGAADFSGPGRAMWSSRWRPATRPVT